MAVQPARCMRPLAAVRLVLPLLGRELREALATLPPDLADRIAALQQADPQRAAKSGATPVTIDIDAGRLTLLATDSAPDDMDGAIAPTASLVFGQGSRTSVDGRLRQVTDTYAVASGGGSIHAQATKGHIQVDGTLSAAAPVLSAELDGDQQHAGTISLSAPQGQVMLGDTARLDVSAAAGKAGQVSVDAGLITRVEPASQTLALSTLAAQARSGLDQLVAISRLSDGGNLGSFKARQRTGSLVLGSELSAAEVSLTADEGDIVLGAQARVLANTASGVSASAIC